MNRQQLPALFLCLIVSLFVSSCHFSEEEKKVTPKEEKPVTKVDITIDTANAFNAMFLDSSMVNDFLHNENLGDTMSKRIKSFYNSRNFQFGWFSPEGLPEYTVSFWNMLKNYLNYSRDSTVYNKEFEKKMEALIRQEKVGIKNDENFRNTELNLTKYFYLYADRAYANEPDFDMKALEWFIPRKKMTLEQMLDSAIAKKGQYADDYAPANPQYKKLRSLLEKYKIIKDAGGWSVVKSNVEEMKKNYESSEVKVLKQRLKIEGFLEGEDSTFTNIYDEATAAAVNDLKKTYGYKADGKAGKTFLKEVNIPVEERIQQILINMERMRWIPTVTGDTGRAIMVNIPEYKLHVYEGGKPAWDMDVVVGKEGNNTTVFTGRLTDIVFSPYWNVPPKIAKEEVLPKGAAYMERNHYELYNGGAVRQKPGVWNSLGLVKFLFPNTYNIYFHDSPAKSLFYRDKRSFSHGCIRLKEPAKLAQYLLNDPVKWNAKKVDEAMRGSEEKYVRLKRSVPVLITYFTAWVNDSSVLNFREDVYGHDEIMAKKMFLNAKKTTQLKKISKQDDVVVVSKDSSKNVNNNPLPLGNKKDTDSNTVKLIATPDSAKKE
jgi:murein L,D-transpeptidase YcbB/YkuD